MCSRSWYIAAYLYCIHIFPLAGVSLFSFPSSKTLITKDDPEHDNTTQALAVLGKVQKLIVDNNTTLSLAELLHKANVTEKDYIDALDVSTNGNVVVLKRDPNECFINNYNSSVRVN